MIEHKIKTYARRAIKTVLWILAGILGLIILAVVALQFHGVQRYIAHYVLSSISEKTHTRIEVGSVTIAFTNSVVLHNIFVESRQRDTLLSIQTLAADVNLLGLFSHHIKLRNVRIDSLTAHITRTLPDSSFNFDFILHALSPDSTTADLHPAPSVEPGWEIRLGGLSLNGVHGTYDDEVSGLNLRLRFGTLEASIDKFDLDKMQFHVDELSLTNAIASVVQTKESPPDESPSADVDFEVGAMSLANLHLNYENIVTGERYSVDLGTSTLLAEKIDLPSHHLALKKFLLENTNIVAVQPKTQENKTKQSDATVLPWIISLDHLILNSNSAQYDVEGAAKIKGVDLNHLRLDGLTMRADNIYFSENRISADIRHTSFRERSGLELRELSGGCTLDSLHARLTDFTVETAGSRIRQNTLLSYSSLSALKNLPGTVNVKATIGDSRLAIADLLFFQPSLPIRNSRGASIRFTSQLSGLVRDLQVEEFQGAVGDSTTVDLNGSIRGLPEAETAYYDVNLRLLSSGRNDIQALIADSVLPKNVVLPASVRMSGNFKGTAKNFSASSVITTSIGSVSGNATFNSGQGPGSRGSRWNTDVIVEDFNVGLLLNDPETFGPVSLKASAAGTGLSKDNIEAQLNVQVDKAVVNGYPYRRFSLQGTASPNMFDGKAEIQDSNIAFTLNGSVNTSKKNPTYKFTLDLKGADLHRLNFTPDEVQVAGIMTSNLSGRDINDINGRIDVRNVLIIKNRKRYAIDSLVYASANKEGQTHISIESTIFGGRFDGTIAPGDLPELLKGHFAHYFTLQGEQRGRNLKAQAFTFHITLRDPATLTGVFFPELHRLSAGSIEGNYDSNKKNLNVSIDIPSVDYNDFKIDSLRVKVTSDADLLLATLKVGSIADSTFRVTNLQLAGKAGHDSIDVALKSTRSDGSTKMLLAGVFNSVPDGYKLRFNKDGIVFQNLPWNVPSDNYLLFGKNKLVAHNVVLRGAGQSLSLQSTDEKNLLSPLRIEFNDFDLATLSHVVERESGLLGGVLNGNVALQNLETKMTFTSDLAIKDFSFGQRHVGDVALRANNQTENVYEVAMDIAGNGNQIAVRGKYRSEEGGNELDLTCDFTKVNLASIEPFTFGHVRRLSGTMTGGLHVTGTRKKPSMSGELNFTNTAFNPTFLDTYLHLNNGKIEIDAQGVEIRSFDLVDTLGNTASLSGRLFTEDFRSYSYDLRAHTDKFLVLNKPASRDALYYGTVILNSDVSVKGDQRRPIVTMQAELDKGTNLAFVLPESQLAVEELYGIVRFVDVNTPLNTIMSRQNLRTSRDTAEARLSSIDLTSNISVNKDSKLRILIDPIAGDSLVIQGEATLSFTIDPSGKLTLTGRYEILKGSYQLSFGDVIRRDFAIEKGSSLTWFGSPYEADVDITAIYTVKAAALDLIQAQLTGISQEERNKYRQELPIQVYLMMKGKLLKPDIHFRLDLPPDQRGVLSGSIYAKLNELNGRESELNKQVFALLVLGRFIPENPLASAGGNGGLSDFARSSGSQILSAQLNRLSEQYLAGANLNVGLDSYQDYSSGNAVGRTQLKLALSKQLFDERVTVQVGGNVDLEGRRSQQNSLNSFAGDLKVLYKLTEDGRWQLQVFRQNSYAGAIDGDITKTGVGVVFTIDFEKLFGITLKPIPDKEGK
ncbi:MAG: translocation/assembly module TamB domain-containing protein [Ignavibacteriales bacterium]|nr:translocation/assembly module TamB domain-containing protein [Ignavibacteriales bacterium]